MKTTKAEVSALVAAAVEQGATVEVVAAKAPRKARSPKAEAFVGPMPQPQAPSAKASATKLAPQDTLVIVKEVDARTTLQRSAKGFGKAWRQNGRTGTSIRYIALDAIASVASEEGTVAYADAVKALTGLDLGCSSPATRISKLVRSGHLEVQSA